MFQTENNRIVQVLAPAADRYNGNPATDIINLANYRHVTFYLQEGAGGTGTAKLELMECPDNTGSGAAAIPFKYRVASAIGDFGDIQDAAAAGYTTAAGADKLVAVEVDAAELSEGNSWAYLQLTEVANSPVAAGVLAVLSEPRFAQALPVDPTQ